jgi:negative regulator of replication initiation
MTTLEPNPGRELQRFAAETNQGLDSLLESANFREVPDETERYLAVLAWCARQHAADFADFVSHRPSGFHYLWMSAAEIHHIRAHNRARQIDGTPFWAVMTIAPTTKRRFVRRLLEFVGCHDATVRAACLALGLGVDANTLGFLLVA